MIVPFYRHSLSPNVAENVAKVISTPFLTSGPIGKEVEQLLCEYFDVKNSKLVNSWTNGAVATLLAADIGPGDEVIVPAMSFIATANVVELVGATPIFIDCDKDTLLITPDLVKKAITNKTKAVIPVHMYGQMCDIKSIREILPENQKILIIEDCAHSFESKIDNYRPGKYSDAAIFSFYATKNVTCGEGGAIITNDEKLYSRIIQAILHGMSAGAADRFKTGKYNHWNMDHLGTKANLPDLLACLLPEQIRTIDQRLSEREKIAAKYESDLSSTKFKLPKNQGKEIVHARHLFTIGVGNVNRDEILNILSRNQIGVTVNYRAIPTMNFYQNKYKIDPQSIANSIEWGNETISLPFYPSLSQEEQNFVVKVLLEEVQPMIERV